jgi:hypothetical protein
MKLQRDFPFSQFENMHHNQEYKQAMINFVNGQEVEEVASEGDRDETYIT